MLEKLKSKIQTFLNKYLSQKQQAYGALILLFLLAVGCLIFVFADTSITEDKNTGEKEKEDVQVVKSEDGTGKIGMKEETAESAEKVKTRIEDTDAIEEPLIEDTNAILIDASPNYALFLGHAGALSIYDKSLKTYRQIDTGVEMASIENLERFVAYTKNAITETRLYNYRIDYPEVEEVKIIPNRFISDLKMHDSIITFIHHGENVDDYVIGSAVPISEQEWKKSKEILSLNIAGIGKHLYQNDERVFFYDANGGVIKGIYPGLYEEKIVQTQMNKEAKFAIKEKDVYTIDKGVLLKNGSSIDSGIKAIDIQGDNFYVTSGIGLYMLKDMTLQLIESDVTSAFANQYNLTFQHVDDKTFVKNFE